MMVPQLDKPQLKSQKSGLDQHSCATIHSEKVTEFSFFVKVTSKIESLPPKETLDGFVIKS